MSLIVFAIHAHIHTCMWTWAKTPDIHLPACTCTHKYTQIQTLMTHCIHSLITSTCLYGERVRKKRESNEVQQLLVCKQTQSHIIISCSPSLAPFSFSHSLESLRRNKFSNPDPLKQQQCFQSLLLIFSPLCTTRCVCTQLYSSPLFSSPILPSLSSIYLSTC